MENTKTIKVKVQLSAFIRLDYEECIEVPADTTPEQLQDLAQKRYDTIDISYYNTDNDYFQRGDCCCVEADEYDPDATATATFSPDGKITVADK